MCHPITETMVTPTKTRQQQYYPTYNNSTQKTPRSTKAGTPPKSGRKNTPSPNTPSEIFKTPKGKVHMMRCASEPVHIRSGVNLGQNRRSVTPTNKSSTSPLNFAGPKCLEPPTPKSLPRPPTTWTRPGNAESARQSLNFEDFCPEPKVSNTIIDPLSAQLMVMLKVNA
jgi:hypothetical protein